MGLAPLRLLLAYGLDKTMKIADIKAAYLNAGLKDVVYIGFPDGFEAKRNTVIAS